MFLASPLTSGYSLTLVDPLSEQNEVRHIVLRNQMHEAEWKRLDDVHGRQDPERRDANDPILSLDLLGIFDGCHL